MRRRTLASFTAMKALTSSRPSEVAKSLSSPWNSDRHLSDHRGVRPRRCSFVEELDRDLKNAGDLVKTARAHPVHAFLVFLNLLEGDAASLPSFFLAHADEHALHANSRANVTVNVPEALLGGDPAVMPLGFGPGSPAFVPISRRAMSLFSPCS